jgi:DNA-directed RNA polymerase subunit RPC12/RpoP
MIVFPCHVCRTDLSADESQAGQLVRCRNCLTTLRVPSGAPDPAAALAAMHAGPADDTGPYAATPPPLQSPQAFEQPGFAAPSSAGGYYAPRPAGRRYGFNCGFCSSRLEATESMAAQEGQCPTCGNTITIPILDRYGRLIDPKTRQIIKQDPHPVHAYAAAGDRAPQIFRHEDGKQAIRCSRCNGVSAINSNNCKSCGMPFTMEGTTLEAAGSSNGFAVASLVLGIIGLPAACAMIPPILAVVFGIIGYSQAAKAGEKGGGRGMAIAGIILGVIGCFIGLALITKR